VDRSNLLFMCTAAVVSLTIDDSALSLTNVPVSATLRVCSTDDDDDDDDNDDDEWICRARHK